MSTIKDMEYTLEVLEKLCTTESPSGFTQKAMKLVETQFTEMGLPFTYTNKGALCAYIPGKSPQVKTAIAAHIDTLGGMVKEIKSSGRLVFTPIGGYMGNSVECENCTIHSADGKTFTGTIYTTKPSVHVHSDSRTLERSFENLEIVLDEKVLKKEEVTALGIEVGDFVSFESRYRVTKKGFVKSRHLDDKASVAIILGTCRFIVENQIVPEHTVQIYISTYEEVGHGASAGLHNDVEELLCVDMGAPGTGQNTDEYTVSICAKDSSGPYDYGIRNKLVSLAKSNQVEYKVDIYPNYGSDGSAALRAGANIRVGLIGPGVFASHSYERTHVDSLRHTANLLMTFIKNAGL